MSDEIRPSVVYREGELTVADYDEAIEVLEGARAELKALENRQGVNGCGVCTDTGHLSESCHHNPLRLARLYVSAVPYWRCFHCDTTFSHHEVEAAQEHFGKAEDEVARCLNVVDIERAIANLDVAEAWTDQGEPGKARTAISVARHILEVRLPPPAK